VRDTCLKHVALFEQALAHHGHARSAPRTAACRIGHRVSGHGKEQPLNLAPGVRLGSYEIASPLGAGGMGEVYRATDTKLNRAVAIKVLPAELAGDGDRLARLA
jgi:serine/threonine protein kinase